MQNLIVFLIPRLAWFYLHFVGITSKIVWLNKEKREQTEQEQKNFIYAFWHGRQFLIAWLYRNRPTFAALVSQSKDGEYIAKTIELLGTQTVRGSSSRGGYRALVELKKKVDSGFTVGLTPDGPRGPKQTIAAGVLVLAQKTSKPILPLTYSAKYKIIFKGWDDYWFPLPFNTFYINYGSPVWISERDNLEEKSIELSHQLNQITTQADLSAQENTTMENFYYFLYNLILIIFSPMILIGLASRYSNTFMADFVLSFRMRIGSYWNGKKIDGNPIWIHAASLGECRAANPLIAAIKEKFPHQPIVLSTMTLNGFNEARKMKNIQAVFFAPLDIPFAVNRAIQSIQPKMILILESDLWPNLLKAAKRFGAPIGIVNGRMSQKSFARYSKASFLTNHLMNKISFLCARENSDAKRFEDLGVAKERISVTGNLKFDYLPLELNEKSSAHAVSFLVNKNDLIWTAGSVREGEESIILESYCRLHKEFPALKLILAPRHLKNLTSIFNTLKTLQIRYILKSKLPQEEKNGWEVLIWDSFGDLWQAYHSCRIAFVGGSIIPKGGQNPLEPAWFSKPVIFGPYMDNFSEPAKILTHSQGAIQVQNQLDLENALESLLENPSKIDAMGLAARKSIEGWIGRTSQATLRWIEPYLKGSLQS